MEDPATQIAGDAHGEVLPPDRSNAHAWAANPNTAFAEREANNSLRPASKPYMGATEGEIGRVSLDKA